MRTAIVRFRPFCARTHCDQALSCESWPSISLHVLRPWKSEAIVTTLPSQPLNPRSAHNLLSISPLLFCVKLAGILPACPPVALRREQERLAGDEARPSMLNGFPSPSCCPSSSVARCATNASRSAARSSPDGSSSASHVQHAALGELRSPCRRARAAPRAPFLGQPGHLGIERGIGEERLLGDHRLLLAVSLIIQRSDDSPFRLRTDRRRPRRQAVPRVPGAPHALYLCRSARAHRRYRGALPRARLRPRPPRRAAAGEPAGVPAALPRAQLARRERGAAQPGLPRRRARVRARRTARRPRCVNAHNLEDLPQARQSAATPANAPCSTPPAPPASRKAACSATSTSSTSASAISTKAACARCATARSGSSRRCRSST